MTVDDETQERFEAVNGRMVQLAEALSVLAVQIGTLSGQVKQAVEYLTEHVTEEHNHDQT